MGVATRRHFLAAVSSVSVLVSGCTQDQDTSLQVGILNTTPRAHSVELSLQNDNGVKFRQQAQIPPAPSNTASSDIETTVLFGDISTNEEYLFSVTVDGYGSKSSPVNVDCAADDGGDQFGVKITEPNLILTDKEC